MSFHLYSQPIRKCSAANGNFIVYADVSQAQHGGDLCASVSAAKESELYLCSVAAHLGRFHYTLEMPLLGACKPFFLIRAARAGIRYLPDLTPLGEELLDNFSGVACAT